MNPQEALQLIDQVLGNMNGTREQHAQLQEAVATLAALVNGTPEQNGSVPLEERIG